MPYRRLPHTSPGGGRYLVTRLTAGALNLEGGMKLFGKAVPLVGSINVLARPLAWHAADSMTLKSPSRAAGVGRRASDWGGACRLRVPWYPPKKKSFSLRTGPPKVPPNWLRFSVSWLAAKKLRAFKEPLRRNSNTLPWNWLVPDFVTAFTVAPGCRPYRAESVLVCTLNS